MNTFLTADLQLLIFCNMGSMDVPPSLAEMEGFEWSAVIYPPKAHSLRQPE